MRLRIEVDGESFDVEVQRREESVRVESEGHVLEARVTGIDDAIRLEAEGRAHVLMFRSDTAGQLDGDAFEYRVDAFQPGEAVAAAGADGRVPVRAAMHGRLVRILKDVGQAVEKGEALFILESMKMQNELQSPAAGVVADVTAREGEVIETGRVLAHLETRPS